eukprot:15334564-Heterocapsa_arctica.AAC.1
MRSAGSTQATCTRGFSPSRQPRRAPELQAMYSLGMLMARASFDALSKTSSSIVPNDPALT